MDFPFVKKAISQLFSEPSCEMYPAVPKKAPAGYRGRIAYNPDKCIGCGMCVRVCAGKAIVLTREPAEGGEYITLRFDLGSCTFCNTCADFCNEKAITLTDDYHMIATREEDLIVTGTHFKEKKKPAPKPAAKAAAPAAAPAPAESAAAASKPAASASSEVAPAPAAPAAPKPREDGKPVQNPDKCIYCTLCAKKCPQEAIEVDRKAKTWILHEDDCVCCGTCQSVCPKDAIIM